MTDIFISYKSERKIAAEHFAEVLRRYGYSVWFDYSLIKGKDFAEQIERQIRASKSVVVLWCSMSVDSRWVREEVHLAHDLGLLIPVKIESCDIPFGWRLADTIDLSSWDGNPRSHQLDPLLNDLETRIGRAAVPDRRALMEYEQTWRRFGAQPLKAFALGEPIEPDNGGSPSVDLGTATGGSTEDNWGAGSLVDRAERDWAWFQIAETEDVAVIEAYIAQYERSEPLWAVRARQRLAEVQAELTAREEARREAERRAAEERERKRQQEEARAKTGAEARDKERRKHEGRAHAWNERTRQPVRIMVGKGRVDWGVWITPGSGKSFRDAGFAPEMAVVPAGRFLMGSPESEEGHNDREGPQHEVTIPQPFAVGRFAVTRAQFEAFVSATGHRTDGGAYGWTGSEVKLDASKSWRDPGFTQTNDHPVVCVLSWDDAQSPSAPAHAHSNHPVVCVSWDDAQAYVKWLSEKTGKCYRLLSEAEWEYAARAGTTTRYAFGDSISTSQAQCSEGSIGSAGKTAQVCSFEPNEWGLHDMHGNVWEWVEDCWNGSYAHKPDSLKASGAAWTAGDCNRRVLRGGSWDDDPQDLRSAIRVGLGRGNRNIVSGFRLARTLTP